LRRITDEHRLVYKVTGDEVRIAACASLILRAERRWVLVAPPGEVVTVRPLEPNGASAQ
jgi:hypothetical protein